MHIWALESPSTMKWEGHMKKGQVQSPAALGSFSCLSHQGSELSQAMQAPPRVTGGKMQSYPWADSNFWREVILTHREQVSEGLHHHFSVQGPLSKVQAFPLLLKEFDSQILESQLCLKWKTHFHWRNSWRVLTFTQDVNRKEAVRIDSVEVMDRFE